MTRSTAHLAAALAVCVAVPATLLAGELEITERSVVTGTSGQSRFAFAGAPRCDSKGNLFVAPLAGSSIDVSVFWSISSDGREVAHLQPRTIPGFEAAGLMAMALSSDGLAHVLVAVAKKGKQSEQYVMTFDRKGKSKSEPLRLKDVRATSIAVFDSGGYLVAGSTEHAGSTLFVVGRDGNLAAAVKPANDPATRPADEQQTGESPAETDWRFLADLTFAESTDDDHVIVVRPTLKGPVYRISASGEVVQALELVPPVGAASLAAVRVSRGRLAALYKLDPDDNGRPRSTIAVFDLATQVRLAEYSNPLGVFACYETDGSADYFRFLRAEGDGLVIARARER